jgi:ABC-type lipoprotein release transport system permease subunit
LSALLIGVTPTDPVTYAATAVLFVGIAIQASLIPAYRATRVDPLSSLRAE